MIKIMFVYPTQETMREDFENHMAFAMPGTRIFHPWTNRWVQFDDESTVRFVHGSFKEVQERLLGQVVHMLVNGGFSPHEFSELRRVLHL